MLLHVGIKDRPGAVVRSLGQGELRYCRIIVLGTGYNTGKLTIQIIRQHFYKKINVILVFFNPGTQ